MSLEVIHELENFEKEKGIRRPVEEKRAVVNKANIFESTRLSKMGHYAGTWDLTDVEIDKSAQMKKKAVNFKYKNMAESKQIGSFKKLDNELAKIAEELSTIYRSTGMKKTLRVRSELMDSIRHTNSLIEKSKRFQSQIERRDLDGVLSSFYYQMAKISSTMKNLEKEAKKEKQIECKARKKSSQSEQARVHAIKSGHILKQNFETAMNFDVRIYNILKILSALRDSPEAFMNRQLRWKIDVSIRQASSTMENMKAKQKQLGNQNWNGIICSYSRQIQKLISDMEHFKNQMGQEEQLETSEKENSDEAMKNEGGKGINLCHTWTKGECLDLSLNKNEPLDQSEVIRGQTYVNQNCSSDLSMPASRNQIDAVKFQEKNGENANLKDTFLKRHLHYAAEQSRLDICQLVVSNGVSDDSLDSRDRTPLHYAAKFGNRDTCQLLVLNNANVDALDSESCTPLH
jgi:hypothetical protein